MGAKQTVILFTVAKRTPEEFQGPAQLSLIALRNERHKHAFRLSKPSGDTKTAWQARLKEPFHFFHVLLLQTCLSEKDRLSRAV